MRVLMLGIMLAGCTTMTEPSQPERPTEAKCDTTPLRDMIGRPASAELGAEALRLSGARVLRWKPPGAMVTMDFRQDRLNASLDANNRVTGFDCG